MRNSFWLIIPFMLLLSCKQTEENTQSVTESNVVTLTKAQIQNAHIATGRLEQKVISSLLKVQGRIEVPPENLVSVSVPLGGFLKSTRLLPGMSVRKGQVIAVMEDNQYIQLQQDYLTAKAQFAAIESEYLRQEALHDAKASSEKVFEQAKSNWATQRILIKSLEEKLRLLRINPYQLTEHKISKSIHIYSPINGFVARVNVNPGRYVTSEEVLFELINPSNVHLTIKVFEKDLPKLFIGQRLSGYTNNEPERKYTGRIILISKDISDGGVEVHCHFDAYDKSLFPGMYMNAEIGVEENLHNALPDEAIVRFEGTEYIFKKLDSNKFGMVAVQTGNSYNGYTEIISDAGLADKEIVVRGAYTLLMSLKNEEE